jgi:tRNA 2-thiouridine synthesizing protein E
MHSALHNPVRPGYEPRLDPDFPDAPLDWTRADAEFVARTDGLRLSEAHWQVICALQAFYAGHEGETIHVRELHDALDEFFHPEGGMRYLYTLFPGGPLAQGCRLAGVTPPAGAADRGFGSVV